MLPAVAQAQFTFTTNNGAITITGSSGTNRIVTIPSSTNGYPVTGIGVYTFYNGGTYHNNNAITNVTIPSTITNVADETFAHCYALTAIAVDTNNPAFSSVAGVLFNQNQTTLIQYPANKAKSSYTISNSVTSIGDEAFYESKITNILISKSVT